MAFVDIGIAHVTRESGETLTIEVIDSGEANASVFAWCAHAVVYTHRAVVPFIAWWTVTGVAIILVDAGATVLAWTACTLIDIHL